MQQGAKNNKYNVNAKKKKKDEANLMHHYLMTSLNIYTMWPVFTRGHKVCLCKS